MIPREPDDGGSLRAAEEPMAGPLRRRTGIGADSPQRRPLVGEALAGRSDAEQCSALRARDGTAARDDRRPKAAPTGANRRAAKNRRRGLPRLRLLKPKTTN